MSSRASRRKQVAMEQNKTQSSEKSGYSLGVDMSKIGQGSGVVSVFDSRSYNHRGDIRGYDTNRILRDKQDNMTLIYDLMNYYVSADDVFSNIITKIYTPFSVASGYQMQATSEKNRSKFNDYFKTIGLDELLENVFYELYLYGQCFLYDRGNYIEILPPRKCRISNISIGGQPIVEYQVVELTQNYTMAKEKFIDSLKVIYQGYPPEILEGISEGNVYTQLNPENLYVIQMPKSAWERFSIPMGVSCLKSFSKKNLISMYEDGMLRNGMKGFLEVRVGSKEVNKTVSPNDLKAVGEIYKQALNNFPLSVVSWEVSSEWKNVDTKELFNNNKYVEVNNNIMTACGISSLIVNGDSASNFAASTINVSTIERRILQNQNKVSNFIQWLMNKRGSEWRIIANKIPTFKFMPTNLQNDGTFKATVLSIYAQGLISKQTAIENLDFSFDQEKARRENENKENLDEVFKLPPSPNTQAAGENGKPPDNSGNVDKNKSASGKAPMPSDNKK